MKKKLKVISSTILFVTTIVVTMAVHALTTKHLMEVKCNKSLQDFEYWHKYAPDPKTTYSLKTVGVRTLLHGNNFVTIEWIDDNIFIDVMARCFSYSGDSVHWIHMMGSEVTHPPVSITCGKGQGLLVGMSSPVDPNPESYKYYGWLTIEQDDDKEEAVTVADSNEEAITNDSIVCNKNDNTKSLSNKNVVLPKNIVSILYDVAKNAGTGASLEKINIKWTNTIKSYFAE
ncbi:hypothetical protein GAMM_200005 [Gammaproteobacteria bacterium]